MPLSSPAGLSWQHRDPRSGASSLLGPFSTDIAARPDLVFDVLSEPYLGQMTRTMADKLQVVERGVDMVLAAARQRHIDHLKRDTPTNGNA